MLGSTLAIALSGLAQASSLFLVAAGLSLIFGVTRIVNFAHGSLFMLGAYIAVSLIARWPTAAGFWLAVIAAALAVGAAGALLEMGILRRLYASPELQQLLATFGVVLVLQDVALKIWGAEEILGPRAPGLGGSWRWLGQSIPQYDIFLILVGPAVLGALWLLLNRTRWGILVRAATQDREMASALGINERFLFTSVFFLGSALAGLGGALQVPREAVNLQMDLAMVVEAFVVVVIGGMGSVTGAFVASVLIGLLHAFGILYLPKITLVLVFLVMAAVLVLRPYGLFGRPPGRAHADVAHLEPPGSLLQPIPSPWLQVALALLALLPLLAGDYARGIASEILILALYAASLQLIMGAGGMTSFGHAAYFGLGAYGAALLVKHAGVGMWGGLLAAPLLAGLGALLFGWFCVRLSGVYLAMLSLAAAQIVWSIAFQWVEVTGGDNGILNVWPAAVVQPAWAYYLLTLAVAGLALYAVRRIVGAPFGYGLRAVRDSAVRSRAIGIDARSMQWQAFTLAGAFAGVAGGLWAHLRGSVFPTVVSVPQSVDALVMVMLGGIAILEGPLLGAGVFHLLKTELLRQTELWRGALGLLIVTLVLVFPQGILGGLLSHWRRYRGLDAAARARS